MKTIRLYELMSVLDDLRYIARQLPKDSPAQEQALKAWAKLHTVIGLADAALDINPPPDYYHLDAPTKWDC